MLHSVCTKGYPVILMKTSCKCLKLSSLTGNEQVQQKTLLKELSKKKQSTFQPIKYLHLLQKEARKRKYTRKYENAVEMVLVTRFW